MRIRRHHDLAAFAELAAPLLHADPLRHTGILTAIASGLRPDPPYRIASMLTLHDGPTLVGAVLRAVGAVQTGAMPVTAAKEVVELLLEHDPDVPGAVGPTEPAQAFAQAWAAATGARTRVDMALRLFVLDELRPPDVPGAWRAATVDDLDLLAGWRNDFTVEALPESWQLTDSRELVERQFAIGAGNVLWEVDGVPVAQASVSPPVAGMSRIGPVWTPPEHRRNGYGSAVTAGASRWAMAVGAERVVLFTDLANPVSNSIYPKIGYRAVTDFTELAFDRP